MIRRQTSSARALAVRGLLLAAASALFALSASSASASVTIKSFKAVPSPTQAGAHPDFSVEFSLSTRQGEPTSCSCNDPKDITVHLPAGLIGNPHATPQCDIAQFSSDICPVDSQLGVAEVVVAIGLGEGGGGQFITPVYNLIPPPGQPALLGFKSGELDSPTFEDVSARTDSDYGLDVKAASIEHFFPLTNFRQITWGVPAAPVHDYLRFSLGQQPLLFASLGSATPPELCDSEGELSTTDPATVFQLCSIGGTGEHKPGAVGEIPPTRSFGPPAPGHPIASNSPTTPFLQNPTTCGDATLASTIDVLSYDRGETHAESAWPPTTGCAQLTFNPSQAISPTTEAADSPSGAEFRLTVPQFESPSVPTPSELRDAVVTLPEGFTLAPNVTNGKETCSDAQARFGTTLEAQCPEHSKIGTISVETPVLPGPLFGAAYLGEPKPGNRFRLILAFDGFGVHVKLAGTVQPDPSSGQIQIAFHDLPQAPFAEFNMHFFGSERGPLDTPTQCGTYEVESVFSPWDSALLPETSRQFFTVDEGPNGRSCPNGTRPFNPAMQAASVANTAGAHTPFAFNLTRSDGDQNLTAIDVTTPPGFTASLKGIPYCSDAALAAAADASHGGLLEQSAPACPPASLVGDSVAAAGPGSHPLYLPGKVYLAGPYKGAPLSFAVITPAVSGGYDLGNVLVRVALQVNPETAQVTAASDPLPQIFEGIPLRLRQILIKLDSNFALNPTNCDPFAVNAAVFGDEGARANLSQFFQVANCSSLAFGPKLSLRLTGGLNRLGHPAIHALVRTQPGEANVSSIAATLPSNEILDQAHLIAVCKRIDFAAGTCPAGSDIGTAEVTTPLLDGPLRGDVFLRTSGSGLPDLALDLHGQIHIEAAAHVDAVHGGLRTTFETVPDVPLGTVKLDLRGGSKGLVQNSESLCGAHLRANVVMRGQNGRRLHRHPPLEVACGKARPKRQRQRAHHGRGK